MEFLRFLILILFYFQIEGTSIKMHKGVRKKNTHRFDGIKQSNFNTGSCQPYG